MLKPIREELGFSSDIYESLDDEMIDVTHERLQDTRRQAMTFEQFKMECFRQKDCTNEFADDKKTLVAP